MLEEPATEEALLLLNSFPCDAVFLVDGDLANFFNVNRELRDHEQVILLRALGPWARFAGWSASGLSRAAMDMKRLFAIWSGPAPASDRQAALNEYVVWAGQMCQGPFKAFLQAVENGFFDWLESDPNLGRVGHATLALEVIRLKVAMAALLIYYGGSLYPRLVN